MFKPGSGFLRDVAQGDVISAAQQQLLIEAARLGFSSSDFFTGGPTGTTLASFPQLPSVWVRNDSGEDLKRFSVLGIDQNYVQYNPASRLELFKGEPFFVEIVPQDPTHRGKFVVLLDDVPDGDTGRAAAAGVVQVQIEITDGRIESADVTHNSCVKLTEDPEGGARILWQEAGTGTKWAIIRFAVPTMTVWKFELDEDLPQWDWAPGGTYTPRDAWKKDWSANANSGKGGYVVNCASSFKVADCALGGFFGKKGANGWARLRRNETDEGFIGVIRGLNCPDQCPCGVDWTEDPSCD